MKRGRSFCLLVILLISFPLVISEHSAEISLVDPGQIYEMNNLNLTILIGNSINSDDSINKITINSSLIDLISAEDPSSWSNQISLDKKSIEWTGGLISSGFRGPFSFNVDILSLDEDLTESLIIQTEDISGAIQTTQVNLTLLDDNLAPRYQLNNPANFSILKPQDVLFDLTVTEEESGLNSAKIIYDWLDSTAVSNQTGQSSLICDSGECSVEIYNDDGSEDNYFGYYFEILDQAGNKDHIDYTDANWFYFYVDNSAPSLSVNASDLVETNQDSYSFDYTLVDNSFGIGSFFEPTVTCSAHFSGESGQLIVYSGIDENNVSEKAANLDFSLISDGIYQWYLNCTDLSGWSDISFVRNITVDRSEPEIEISYPDDNGWANGEFHFTAIDNVYEEIFCSLYINDSLTENGTVSNGFENIWEVDLLEGDSYSWFLSCRDGVNNQVTSETRFFTVDISFPTLTNITSEAGQDSAVISWQTDESSDHAVYYGTSSSDLSFSETDGTGTSAQITLSGLSPSTTYYYSAESCDRANNCRASSVLSFTTSGQPSSSTGGGGSTSSGNDDENREFAEESSCEAEWDCDAWGECLDGAQERNCYDINCDAGSRIEEKKCVIKDSDETNFVGVDQVESESEGTSITGAITKEDNEVKNSISFVLVGVISLALAGLGIWKRKKIFGNFHKIIFYRKIKREKEEAEIRKKLKQSGLIKY